MDISLQTANRCRNGVRQDCSFVLLIYYIYPMIRYFVYVLTNKNHTVLYTGFTDDLERRTYEHKNKILKGFTVRYNVDKLVYYEEFNEKESAMSRERQLKKYKRHWKENLINEINPHWRDLYEDFIS